jgi:hypothetical protein
MSILLTELNVYDLRVKRNKVFNNWFVSEGFGETKYSEEGYAQSLLTTSGIGWIHNKLFINSGEQT